MVGLVPLYEDHNQTVLSLKPKAVEFLKGFATNAPEAPQSAFIDLKGRIVAVFDQKILSEEEALLVTGKSFVGRLREHLKKYLFLNDASLEEKNFRVYVDFSGRYPADSRHWVIPKGPGRLVISPEPLPADASEEDYTAYRLRHFLPLQGVDFDRELILNVFNESHISYEKGCYLGQEIVARVHHRGKPPKRLLVKDFGACDEAERSRLTSKHLDKKTGKVSGFLFVNNEEAT